MNTIDKMDQLSAEHAEWFNRVLQVWSNEVLFSWRWWLGIGLTLAAWLLWIIYHKRESRYRLLTAGFFVMTISISLDAIGIELGLWSYRYEVTPFIPAYVPYDAALMPVVIMSLIQFRPALSPYLKAAIFGTLTALIGEPAITALNIYHPVNWHFYYSIPIYALIFLIAHWITTRDDYKRIHHE